MSSTKYVSQITRAEKRTHEFKARTRSGYLLRVKAIIIDHGQERAGPNRWETEYIDTNTKKIIHRAHSVIMPSEDRMLAAFSTFINQDHV